MSLPCAKVRSADFRTGHYIDTGLKLFRPPRRGYSCDECGANLRPGEQVYCCRECNYDICMKCHNGKSYAAQDSTKAKRQKKMLACSERRCLGLVNLLFPLHPALLQRLASPEIDHNFHSSEYLRTLCDLFFHPSHIVQNRLVDMLGQVLPLLPAPAKASVADPSTLQSSFVQRLMAHIASAVKFGLCKSPCTGAEPQYVVTQNKVATGSMQLLRKLLECRWVCASV